MTKRKTVGDTEDLRRRGKGRSLPGQDLDLDEGFTIRIGGGGTVTILNRELVRIGNIDTGHYIEIDHNGFRVYEDYKLRLWIQQDGDILIGEEADDDTKVRFLVTNTNITHNEESLGAGDLLIGLNTDDHANMLYDSSQDRLEFRGGTTVKCYIHTDGAFTAGAGDVTLDEDGLLIQSGLAGDTKRIQWKESTAEVGEIYAGTDPGVSSQLRLIGRGRGSVSAPTTHEGYILLQAITSDGAAHAGAASVTLDLDTDSDTITIAAGEVVMSGGLRVNNTGNGTSDDDFHVRTKNVSHALYVSAANNVVGIGTQAVNSNASLDGTDAAKPFILPVMTATQIGNVTPAEGMIAFDTTNNVIKFYDGADWQELAVV